MGLWILGIIVIIVVIILWGISTYNKLIQAKEMIANGMAQIAAQIESRWDALSSLIEATKKYQTHESETLTQIVAQRSQVNRGSSVSDVVKDDEAFQHAMRAINVVVEQYPNLKAADVYQNTMNSINQYENNVRQSRMVFNDTVTRFNRLIKVFPNVIIAGLFHFSEEAYFEGTKEKAAMPQW